MNAGLKDGQLSACFVVPVDDSIAGISDALKEMAIIHQSGGGTGFSFSKLRPRGDPVRSTGGVASGPVSFMEIFNKATEVVKQGGRRRGANMAVLKADHPDIEEFVHAKEVAGRLENFNISVGATDQFMHKATLGQDLELVNPRTGDVSDSLDARHLLREIATTAWKRGDPGMLFLDTINRSHPVPGVIEATNPCGEQPLLSHESCNLGSINLSRFVAKGEIEWDQLGDIVSLAVRFLDDVIEMNSFPFSAIEDATLKTRKIGLGVMGFAEMLIEMEISYNSTDALDIAEKVMSFISSEAREESRKLGVARGSFPLMETSSLEHRYDAMRNATVTTISPTGTISILAGTSPGIEPLFAVSFSRDLLGEKAVVVTSPHFEKMAKKWGVYSPKLMKTVAEKGTLQDVKVPTGLKEIFVTAMEVSPKQHVRMQAAFQKYTDNAVSKTVNLSNEAKVKDVVETFELAHKLGCKGTTVYRYGCRDQVLYLGETAGRCERC